MEAGNWWELGGWLWLIIDVVLVAVLGIALAYGVIMWRRRSRDREFQHAREEATRHLYQAEADDERHRPAA